MLKSDCHELTASDRSGSSVPIVAARTAQGGYSVRGSCQVQGDALVVEFGFETSDLTSLQSSGILMTHPPQSLEMQEVS